MASRAQSSSKKSGRSGTKTGRKKKSGQVSGRSAKGTSAGRGKRAPARKSASRGAKSRKVTAPPARDIEVQEGSGATVYAERSDVPHPGVIGETERINAEDHSSPRSRLADGSESVVRHPEE